MTLETGAIKELSEQSNCSILRSTKIGSAKERDQYILIPQGVIQQKCILLQAELSNLKEIEYPPVDLNTPPAAIHIFNTSIPGSLGLKIVPRRYLNIQRNHFPSISKLPQESPI